MLKLYNTLTKKRENFTPLKDKKVGMYVCGPTVYGPSHLGHARTWLFFDWLRRYLQYKGYKVRFVQNITDVGHLVGDAERGEDKIEKEAKSKTKTPQEIARFYEKEYFEDLEALNILKPDVSPRATEHIGEIIDFVKVLLKKGYAYEVDGNVYFDISKFSGYGELSSRKIDEEITDTRVKADPKKKNQADFALWLRADKKHLQKWPSPWGLSRVGSSGEGYPGWHIECSVLSKKYLGQPFDIHGAASELIFPHHENELSQSRAYANKPLARFWLHSGMLLINNKKMSKSLKNYITVRKVLEKDDADTVKLAFMATFWRRPFDWNKKALSEARKLKERLVRAKMEAQLVKTGFPTQLEQALDDDFNLPKTLAIVLGNISKLSRKDFEVLEKIFGLKLTETIKLSKKQEKLIKEREKARDVGDYKKADKIRKTLEKENIIVEDTLAGTRIISK